MRTLGCLSGTDCQAYKRRSPWRRELCLVSLMMVQLPKARRRDAIPYLLGLDGSCATSPWAPAIKQDEKHVRFRKMLGCGQPEGSWKPRVSIQTAKQRPLSSGLTGAMVSAANGHAVCCVTIALTLSGPQAFSPVLQQSPGKEEAPIFSLSSKAAKGPAAKASGPSLIWQVPRRVAEKHIRGLQDLLPCTVARPQQNNRPAS